MTIGSPALAGYSLTITRLNSRWLTRQFSEGPRFFNENEIPLAISAFQHIPFTIDTLGPLLPSLIVLPKNDRYWDRLATAAKQTKGWSIPMAMNVLWVLAAFVITIVDSLVDFRYFITVPGDAGYSIAAVWAYLLPLVVGWLYVGYQPEANHLSNALEEVHEITHVAAPSSPDSFPVVCGHYAIDYSTEHIDYVNADEKKTTPIFNYSRVFTWSQHAEHILKLYKNAADKAHRGIPVQRGGTWTTDDDGKPSPSNRIGNEVEVIQYCTPGVPDLGGDRPKFPIPQVPHPGSTPLPEHPAITSQTAGMDVDDDKFVHERTATASSGDFGSTVVNTLTKSPTDQDWEKEPPMSAPRIPEDPVFATFAEGVFQRVAFATVLALALQWSTTGAAMLIHFNTPPKGIGCRATTFTSYGVTATVAFLLFLLSSVLAHLARPQIFPRRQVASKSLIGYIATFARWLGKFMAIMNGLGILLSSTMQIAGVYDSCFCSSSIFRGDPNGLVSFTILYGFNKK